MIWLLVLFALTVAAICYGIVASNEIEREETAEYELWARDLSFYASRATRSEDAPVRSPQIAPDPARAHLTDRCGSHFRRPLGAVPHHEQHHGDR